MFEQDARFPRRFFRVTVQQSLQNYTFDYFSYFLLLFCFLMLPSIFRLISGYLSTRIRFIMSWLQKRTEIPGNTPEPVFSVKEARNYLSKLRQNPSALFRAIETGALAAAIETVLNSLPSKEREQLVKRAQQDNASFDELLASGMLIEEALASYNGSDMMTILTEETT